jgi:hypothetical protein
VSRAEDARNGSRSQKVELVVLVVIVYLPIACLDGRRGHGWIVSNKAVIWCRLTEISNGKSASVYECFPFIWPCNAQPVLLKSSTTSRPQGRNADYALI